MSESLSQDGDGGARDAPRASTPPASVALSEDARGNSNGEVSGGEGSGENTRTQFGNYVEFLLVNVGYAVGLGNLIVYPGRVYEYGGGAFLIAYWIWLFVLGVPLFALELKIGQFFQAGPFQAFYSMHKRLWGVGMGQIIMALIAMVYYNVVISWVIVYIVYSFQSPLPWKEDAEAFFYDKVLGASSGIGDVTAINWPILGANALAWVLVFLVLIKGVVSSGKVAYVTTLAPYVCILVLVVRGATLPGHMEGLREYLLVDTAKLASFSTWTRAANQIFFSLGVSMGGVVTFSSHQKRESSNYVRDAVIIPTINCLTSFVTGFAIFQMMGYLAYTKTLQPDGSYDVEDGLAQVSLSGFSLAFVAYTQALATFSEGVAQVFSVIFFLMVFFLGINTQIGVVQAVITFFKDAQVGHSRSWLTGVLVCSLGFVLGIPCVTNAGYYWTLMMWEYGNYASMFVIACMVLVGASWVAGTKWHDQASKMLRGKGDNPLLVFLWRFIDPVICVVLLVATIISQIPFPKTLGYHGEGTGIYPEWAQVISILLNYSPILVVLFGLVLPLPSRWTPKREPGPSESFENQTLVTVGSVLSTDNIHTKCIELTVT